MNTEIHIVRHGQTHENLAGILQGHFNSSLDETGLAQAHAAAERMVSFKLDAIYSSDLRRAAQTAQIISQRIKMEVIAVPELREWNLGHLEKRKLSDLKAEYPEIIKSFQHDLEGDVLVPGGESCFQFRERVASFLDWIVQKHRGKKLLLVTHGGTMRCIFHHLIGNVAVSNLLPAQSNGGYSRIYYRASGEWQLDTWNDTSHLQHIPRCENIAF